MKKQRLKIVIITVIIFTFAVVVTALFVREIIQQSAILRAQIATLQQDQAQQTQLAQLKKLVIETETDRAELDSYYLTSQSDSIDFLNYIEQLASTQGVGLETVRATELERDKTQLLIVQYNIGGSRLQLERFVSLLENVPFVSEVVELQLNKRTAVSWEATVTIEIIVLESHETTS